MQDKNKAIYGLLVLLAVLIAVLAIIAVYLGRKLESQSYPPSETGTNRTEISLLNDRVEIGGRGYWSLARVSNTTLVEITQITDTEYLLTFIINDSKPRRFSIKSRSHLDYAYMSEDSRKLYLHELNQHLSPGDHVELILIYIEPRSSLDNNTLRDYYLTLPTRTTRPTAQQEIPENLAYLGSFGSNKTTYQDLLNSLNNNDSILDEDSVLLKQIIKRANQ
jgi:hypothetical protein